MPDSAPTLRLSGHRVAVPLVSGRDLSKAGETASEDVRNALQILFMLSAVQPTHSQIDDLIRLLNTALSKIERIERFTTQGG